VSEANPPPSVILSEVSEANAVEGPSQNKGPEKLRALFHNREFLAYFIARQSGWLAMSVADVAIGWQVFALRHNAFDLGLIGLIAFLPQLLLALPAGVLADRVDRRLIGGTGFNIINLGCSLAYVWLAYTHTLSLAAWFAALAVQSTAAALAAPAQRSILAQIVQGERFIRASALTSSFAQLIRIAGPALAGLLIAIDVPFAFIAAALAQLCAAIAYAMLAPRPPDVSTNEDASMLQHALQGVRYIVENKVVLGAISLDLFAVLFGGATALLPLFATQILHVGAVGFGLLRAAPAIGAAFTALFIVRRPLRRNGGRWLFWCVGGFGIFTIVFGLSRSFLLSFAALALAEACDMASVTIRIALVQLRTPDGVRGRVSAVENVFIGASNELGAFESGAVASLIGAVPCVVLGGAATLAVIGLWSLILPSLRRLDRLTN
jgi:MFS family permease